MAIPRIGLRPATTEDGEAIAEIYAPIVRDTFISFETEPPSAAAMEERIAATLTWRPWLVAAAGDEILGYAYAGEHRQRPAYRWSTDVTVYVSTAARGQGVGRQLYAALISTLLGQGFRSAFAGIALPNTASVALHEVMGFEPLSVFREVGFKLGAWRDVGWWRLGLSEDDCTPTEPIPFATYSNTPAFASLMS